MRYNALGGAVPFLCFISLTSNELVSLRTGGPAAFSCAEGFIFLMLVIPRRRRRRWLNATKLPRGRVGGPGGLWPERAPQSAARAQSRNEPPDRGEVIPREAAGAWSGGGGLGP